jgi:transcriptional regulator with PAS, ATPase and Fis domain
VLEERQIERLGSVRSTPVNTRVIAATHRSLEERIADGSFRADLFYRLNVFPLRVPPLRERAEDIPALIWRFIDQFSVTFERSIEDVPDDNMAALQRYYWPGNIRELRNAVERAMIQATGLPLADRPSYRRSSTISWATSSPGFRTRQRIVSQQLRVLSWRARRRQG